MAQEHNISSQLSEHMGWIWTAIGVVGAGIVGVFRWLFNQNNRMKDIESAVEKLQEKEKETEKSFERITTERKEAIADLKSDITEIKAISQRTNDLILEHFLKK